MFVLHNCVRISPLILAHETITNTRSRRQTSLEGKCYRVIAHGEEEVRGSTDLGNYGPQATWNPRLRAEPFVLYTRPNPSQ